MSEIDVSTKTIIAISNLKINLEKFYEYIPITPFKPIEKKRGRKKKIAVEQTVDLVPEGSIINVQRKNNFRGVLLKKKKNTNTYFLHSVTMVLSIEKNKFYYVLVDKYPVKILSVKCKGKNVSNEVSKYLGPMENFHGSRVSPNRLGYDELEFEYLDDEMNIISTVFKQNDIINI